MVIEVLAEKSGKGEPGRGVEAGARPAAAAAAVTAAALLRCSARLLLPLPPPPPLCPCLAAHACHLWWPHTSLHSCR